MGFHPHGLHARLSLVCRCWVDDAIVEIENIVLPFVWAKRLPGAIDAADEIGLALWPRRSPSIAVVSSRAGFRAASTASISSSSASRCAVGGVHILMVARLITPSWPPYAAQRRKALACRDGPLSMTYYLSLAAVVRRESAEDMAFGAGVLRAFAGALTIIPKHSYRPRLWRFRSWTSNCRTCGSGRYVAGRCLPHSRYFFGTGGPPTSSSSSARGRRRSAPLPSTTLVPRGERVLSQKQGAAHDAAAHSCPDAK